MMPKRLALTIIMPALLFLSACSHNNSTIDYNPNTDFTSLKSYSFKINNSTPTHNPANNKSLMVKNSLMAKRIEVAINTAMATKNLSPSSHPDIVINYYMNSISSDIPSNRGSIGIGGGGSNIGVGISLDLPIGSNKPHKLEQLTIDILSANNGELLWRGVNSFKQSAKSPEKNQQRIQDTVQSILANYPPQEK